MTDSTASDASLRHVETRRAALKVVLGASLVLPFVGFAAAQEADGKDARPRSGDRFVFAYGERSGQVITPKDLRVGGPHVIAYPVDPATGLVRNGSRLNEVLLIRFDAAELSVETRSAATEGIVAYSAICTHAGCEVTVWQAEEKILHCSCHDSLFDPKDDARVVGGPARRRLSRLPLALASGELVAAGGFSGRVGFQTG